MGASLGLCHLKLPPDTQGTAPRMDTGVHISLKVALSPSLPFFLQGRDVQLPQNQKRHIAIPTSLRQSLPSLSLKGGRRMWCSDETRTLSKEMCTISTAATEPSSLSSQWGVWKAASRALLGSWNWHPGGEYLLDVVLRGTKEAAIQWWWCGDDDVIMEWWWCQHNYYQVTGRGTAKAVMALGRETSRTGFATIYLISWFIINLYKSQWDGWLIGFSVIKFISSLAWQYLDTYLFLQFLASFCTYFKLSTQSIVKQNGYPYTFPVHLINFEIKFVKFGFPLMLIFC